MDLAGRDMTDFLQTHLAEDGYAFKSSAEKEIVKKIKEEFCYVAYNYEDELKEFEQNPEKKK